MGSWRTFIVVNEQEKSRDHDVSWYSIATKLINGFFMVFQRFITQRLLQLEFLRVLRLIWVNAD